MERRLHEIYWLLKQIYGDIIVEGEKILNPAGLYTTQRYLESDKLGIVFRETLLYGYNAPIIVVRGRHGRFYIIDGHHRAKVALWIRSLVKAFVLNIPSYHRGSAVPISAIKVINPPNTVHEPIIDTWRHMVNIISFLERKHSRTPRVWFETLEITSLYATQPYVSHMIPKDIFREPILVYEHMGEYYVIDGHTRACARLMSGEEKAESVVFTLNEEIGIMKSAVKIGMPIIDRDYCLNPLNQDLRRP